MSHGGCWRADPGPRRGYSQRRFRPRPHAHPLQGQRDVQARRSRPPADVHDARPLRRLLLRLQPAQAALEPLGTIDGRGARHRAWLSSAAREHQRPRARLSSPASSLRELGLHAREGHKQVRLVYPEVPAGVPRPLSYEQHQRPCSAPRRHARASTDGCSCRGSVRMDVTHGVTQRPTDGQNPRVSRGFRGTATGIRTTRVARTCRQCWPHKRSFGPCWRVETRRYQGVNCRAARRSSSSSRRLAASCPLAGDEVPYTFAVTEHRCARRPGRPRTAGRWRRSRECIRWTAGLLHALLSRSDERAPEEIAPGDVRASVGTDGDPRILRHRLALAEDDRRRARCEVGRATNRLDDARLLITLGVEFTELAVGDPNDAPGGSAASDGHQFLVKEAAGSGEVDQPTSRPARPIRHAAVGLSLRAARERRGVAAADPDATRERKVGRGVVIQARRIRASSRSRRRRQGHTGGQRRCAVGRPQRGKQALIRECPAAVARESPAGRIALRVQDEAVTVPRATAATPESRSGSAFTSR
jgi:hypothetical protein